MNIKKRANLGILLQQFLSKLHENKKQDSQKQVILQSPICLVEEQT